MEISVLHEKLMDDINENWQISKTAVQRFRESLPNILSLVNEKFRLEALYADNRGIQQNLDFIMDAHRHFGEMLLTIYQFQLWHIFLDEAAWYVQSIQHRDLDERYFVKMLKT